MSGPYMKATFLDRDGVIIRKAPEREYIASWVEVEFLPGALDAIVRLSNSGYKVIIVTNQRGIATGKIECGKLEEIHSKIKATINSYGGNISGIYYCPHDNSANCACRKPKPGMLLQAAHDHYLNLSECWMIGDTVTDIRAGKTAGCKTALIAICEELRGAADMPDVWEQSLASAAKRILTMA